MKDGQVAGRGTIGRTVLDRDGVPALTQHLEDVVQEVLPPETEGPEVEPAESVMPVDDDDDVGHVGGYRMTGRRMLTAL